MKAVFDNGSYTSKVGFSLYDSPSSVISSRINHGEKIIQPIKKGKIQSNRDDIEQLWDKCYDTLAVEPSSLPVFMTECPMMPLSNKQHMAEVFFEKYEVPSMCIETQGLMALYAAGHTTGLVIEMGDGQSHLCASIDGRLIPTSVTKFDVSGGDISEYLKSLIEINHNYYFNTITKDSLSTIKETLCYTAVDYQSELQMATDYTFLEESYQLPDQTILQLNSERIDAAEIIFNPSLVMQEVEGLHQQVMKVINGCPIDCRRSLFSNIVLSGGTTLFSGLKERLQKELKVVCPNTVSVDVTANEDRLYSNWIGSSIIASLEDTPWLSRETYAECGVNSLVRNN